MRNDAPLNEKVGGVEATDGEGVRYRLEPGQSSESALTYFRVEPESGDIVLQGDLTNELYTEYKLAVTAYDLGTPSLQTTVELRVVVQQVVTLPPNTGVGFQEVEHQIQVMENTPQEAVLKTIQLSNKPERNIRMECEVTEATDREGRSVANLFRAELNSEKNCQLILARSSLDYETMDSYTINIRLNTLTAFTNPGKNVARVKVIVLDQNDNSPVFRYEADYNALIPGKYLVTVPQSRPAGEEIFRVAAEDADSGELGEVKYGISPNTERTTRGFFQVDSQTGAVTLRKSLEDVDVDMRPFRNCSIIPPHTIIIPLFVTTF